MTNMKKALLICSGCFSKKDLEGINLDNYYKVAVDGGIEHFIENNIEADIYIGDMDSTVSEVSGIEKILLDIEKDKTDTEYAIDFLIEKDYKEILILAGTGSRLDHTLGNIRLLYKLMEHGINSYIKNSNNKIYLLGKGKHILEKDKNFKYISFIPLKDDVRSISLLGFKYKLDNYRMNWNDNIGISNEIIQDNSEVRISNGVVITIESRD